MNLDFQSQPEADMLLLWLKIQSSGKILF